MTSCGLRMIKVSDVLTGDILHSFKAPQRVIALEFDRNLLMAASSSNHLVAWDLNDAGQQLPERPWHASGEGSDARSRCTPYAISISIAHRMLAIAYSGRPITLWDLEGDEYYGECGKKSDTGESSTHRVTALVLNPNASIELLAVSYLDGELVLLDPFQDVEMQRFRANCHTLAASPDGRLLAGGGGMGVIELYEFDTLRILYRVRSTDIFIKQLAFSKDSKHCCDIRGSHCNIWDLQCYFGTLRATTAAMALQQL